MKTRQIAILSSGAIWLLLNCPAALSAEPAAAEILLQRARVHLHGEGAEKDPGKAFELMKWRAANQKAESGSGYLFDVCVSGDSKKGDFFHQRMSTTRYR